MLIDYLKYVSNKPGFLGCISMREESQKFIAFREHLTGNRYGGNRYGGNRYGGKKYFGKYEMHPFFITELLIINN